MATFKTLEDIIVWQKARAFHLELKTEITILIQAKDYELKEQLKSSSGSVMDNIAEGFEYENNLQFVRYLRYSKGSAGEIRSMITAFEMTKQISKDQHDKLIEKTVEISKNIKGFMKYLANSKKQ
jgi:four helix bundle protein